jgi:hypothetical protein
MSISSPAFAESAMPFIRSSNASVTDMAGTSSLLQKEKNTTRHTKTVSKQAAALLSSKTSFDDIINPFKGTTDGHKNRIYADIIYTVVINYLISI